MTTLLCPVGASLDDWSSHEWADGVQIEALPVLATLVVRTCNNTYEVTVISASAGDVLVRGGPFFPTPTRTHLSGSSLGGSFLKCQGIYVGFRMEFQHEGQRILTTSVRSITQPGTPAPAWGQGRTALDMVPAGVTH